jgi:hypothetical protein
MISRQIYNNMKKISLLLTLFLLLTSTGASYAEGFFQTARTGSEAASGLAIKGQNDADRVTDLKQRAKKEITRRINFLNELLKKIDKIKKLSDSDKQTLKNQIQTQIDGLNALQTKIDADTDLTTLRADVKSIINGYYIFAFFRVKIELLVAADRMSATTDNLNIIYTKLQTRINEAQTKGKDVTKLNVLLSDMLTKINDAKTQYSAVESELNVLTAQGFPGNKSSLLDARAKIKLGGQDLRAVHQDAVKIRQGLEDIKGDLKKGDFDTKNSTSSGKE